MTLTVPRRYGTQPECQVLAHSGLSTRALIRRCDGRSNHIGGSGGGSAFGSVLPDLAQAVEYFCEASHFGRQTRTRPCHVARDWMVRCSSRLSFLGIEHALFRTLIVNVWLVPRHYCV
jgi:hypothetical protein